MRGFLTLLMFESLVEWFNSDWTTVDWIAWVSVMSLLGIALGSILGRR